ncbi:MAG: phospholipase, partial [Clostridia bacterium]|nr:phospholipase [Clostridia bacterium]
MDNGIFEKFRKETYVAEDGYTMPYRLYIPDDYDCGEEYPLVFFLHGAGERGDDNEKQLAIGIRHMFWEGSPAYNSIIVAPQCACDKRWVDIDWDYGVFNRKQVKETRELQTAMTILKEVMEFCNVDRDRVYVTGISMGGYGTFDALARHGS